MQKKFWLSLFLIIETSCVTIPNTRNCAVAGRLAAGAFCSDTLTGETSDMTLDQFIAFLEPQIEPPRAGAICQSAEDFSKVKTVLEQACRELGSRCSYEFRKMIRSYQDVLVKAQKVE